MNMFKKGKSDNDGRFDGMRSEKVGMSVDYIQLWDDATKR